MGDPCHEKLVVMQANNDPSGPSGPSGTTYCSMFARKRTLIGATSKAPPPFDIPI